MRIIIKYDKYITYNLYKTEFSAEQFEFCLTTALVPAINYSNYRYYDIAAPLRLFTTFIVYKFS